MSYVVSRQVFPNTSINVTAEISMNNSNDALKASREIRRKRLEDEATAKAVAAAMAAEAAAVMAAAAAEAAKVAAETAAAAAAAAI